MATTTKIRRVKEVSIQHKFKMMREDMNASLIERHDEIDMVLTALIAQENPLLVGPPGTAKSLLLDSLARWMGNGARTYTQLFNRFTVPEEVFGPVSVQGLKNDEYRRITTGKLPEAHFAFADEIFKASSAILNTMLRVLNERVYDNGKGELTKCPLLICVAASNEWPGEQHKELGALFDRFLFRKTVKQVSRVGRQQLLWGRDHTPKLRTSISPDELQQAHEEAKALEFTTEAAERLEAILDKLAENGIRPGDRRMYKSVTAAQSFAYLMGSSQVEPEHLDILQHVLWDDPTEQPEKTAQIVTKLANPVGAHIADLMAQASDVVERNSHNPTEVVTRLKQLKSELEVVADHRTKTMAVDYVNAELKRFYNQVIGV